MSTTVTTISSKILDTVKEAVLGDATDDAFDPDLIMHINSTIAILKDMGIGNSSFEVTGNETWADFLNVGTTSTEQQFAAAKSYLCLKVRLLFDPPASSVITQSINSSLKELEWRIYSLANYS